MKDNDFLTIFIFPFKYEETTHETQKPDEIGKKLHHSNSKPEMGWAMQHYTLNTEEHYNEFHYFHPFVRQVIFNKEENSGMEYLTRTDFNCLEIEYCQEENKKHSITTAVKSIDLHLFDNQIGLLTITTEKRGEDEETDYDTFLRYNDIARRVYPPYLGNGENNTDAPKCISKLIPSRVTLFHRENKDKNIIECFNHINLNTKTKKDILHLSNIIQRLLYPFKLKEDHNMKKKDMQRNIYYTPFTDDRMFIVSYYSDADKSGKLTERCCGRYDYETSDEWYRFVFVDGDDVGIANETMKKDLIRRHTYSRWQDKDSGVLFGMSRYSFVLLCGNKWFPRIILKQHMKSMYYQIALIIIFQRAMLLRFSEEITELTERFEEENFPDLREEASKLHGDFIRFINKYWFIDVTPQEQGIEIYSQWMSLLNIEKLFNEIQREISELTAYIDNKLEAKTNKNLAHITIIGVPFIIIGLMLNLLEIYAQELDKFKPLYTLEGWKELFTKSSPLNSFILLFPVLVIASILSIYVIRRIFKNKNNLISRILYSRKCKS